MTTSLTSLLVSEINISGTLLGTGGLYIDDTHLTTEEKQGNVEIITCTDEQAQRSLRDHDDFRIQMLRTFSKMFRNTLSGDATTFPVAKITYVAGLLIATDPFIRENFYASYNGLVPAFFQFLLDHFRIGVLPDNNHLLKYQRTDECFVKITECTIERTFLNMNSDYYIQLYFSYVLAWFVELNKLDSKLDKPNKYFDYYVQLEPVPIAANQPIIFPGLCIKGNKAFWYKSCASLESTYKRTCHIIAHSIKSNLILEQFDSEFFEDMFTEGYHVEEVSLESLERDLLDFILSYTPPSK